MDLKNIGKANQIIRKCRGGINMNTLRRKNNFTKEVISKREVFSALLSQMKEMSESEKSILTDWYNDCSSNNYNEMKDTDILNIYLKYKFNASTPSIIIDAKILLNSKKLTRRERKILKSIINFPDNITFTGIGTLTRLRKSYLSVR